MRLYGAIGIGCLIAFLIGLTIFYSTKLDLKESEITTLHTAIEEQKTIIENQKIRIDELQEIAQAQKKTQKQYIRTVKEIQKIEIPEKLLENLNQDFLTWF